MRRFRDQESTLEQVYLADLVEVLDERLGQIHNVLIRIQMTGEELLAEARHARAALTPKPAYSAVGDDLDEELEPDIDDEPPPDVGPHAGAVIREWD